MQLFRKVMGGVLILAAVGLCSCGQSSSHVQPRTSIIVLKAATTAPGTTPISAIEVTFTLPEGMSVATSGGTSEQIATDGLTTSAGLTGTNIASGTYSPSNRATHLSFVTTGDNYTGGEFLRVTCNIAPNANITPDSIRTGTPVTVVKAVGYDPARKSTVPVTGVSVTLDMI
jgi:hypothetical protein